MDARKDNTAAPYDDLHTPCDCGATSHKKPLPTEKRFGGYLKALALADVHHVQESIDIDVRQ